MKTITLSSLSTNHHPSTVLYYYVKYLEMLKTVISNDLIFAGFGGCNVRLKPVDSPIIKL